MTKSLIILESPNKIKAYRDENNLSLKEFGKLIGVSAQAVYKWEQNTCYPDIIFLPHLARILNWATDDFFEIHGGDANE